MAFSEFEVATVHCGIGSFHKGWTYSRSGICGLVCSVAHVRDVIIARAGSLHHVVVEMLSFIHVCLHLSSSSVSGLLIHIRKP